MLLLVTAFVACAPAGAIAKGWSGVAVTDNTLYIASMGGNLVALNAQNRERVFADHPFRATTPSSFGCGGGQQPVAIYGTPAVGSDLVYLAGHDGKVYAINAKTGADRWIYPRQGVGAPIVGGILIAGDRLYFGDSAGKAYALDAATGDLVWTYEAGGAIWSNPAVDKDTVYFGSFDKKLYALDARTGKPKWSPFATLGALASSPVLQDGTVYIGSFDRRFYAINGADGSLKWQSLEAGNWFWSRPVISGGLLYAGNLDGKVYAYRADNGELVNTFALGGPVSSSLAVADGNVIAATERGQIHVIEGNQKRLLATLSEEIYAPLAVGNNVVYVHGARDILYGLDVQTGTTRWTLDLKSK